MNASEIGSNDWWLVVLSMPADESLENLQRYRSLLLEETVGTPAYLRNAIKITRINDEMKKITKRTTEAQWQAVCKRLLPPDLYDEVRMQIRIIQDDLKVNA
jgi:phosphoribosyl-dephospho-CoA transferase